MPFCEIGWRRLLWFYHGCSTEHLYGDDGEMQCAKCLVDFKRWTPQAIEKALQSAVTREAMALMDVAVIVDRGKANNAH